MLDILDKLENEKGCVEITLASGDRVKGYTDVIVWIEADEDDQGSEITKAIWFKPYGSKEYVSLTREDIRSYKLDGDTGTDEK